MPPLYCSVSFRFSPDYQTRIRSSGAKYIGVPSVTDGYV